MRSDDHFCIAAVDGVGEVSHYKLYCLTSSVIREFKIRDFMKLLSISPHRIETYLHCRVPSHSNIGKYPARPNSSQGFF